MNTWDRSCIVMALICLLLLMVLTMVKVKDSQARLDLLEETVMELQEDLEDRGVLDENP